MFPPVKVALGHVVNVLEKDIDYIFLPSLVNMKQNNEKLNESYNCPYVQSLPYTIRSAVNFDDYNVKVIDPALFFRYDYNSKVTVKALAEMAKEMGIKTKLIKGAVKKAGEVQDNFYKGLQTRGADILDSLKPDDKAVIIVSRPYNGCDPGLNLGLPKKLMDLGVIPIPLDFLPIDTVDISDDWPNMYWRYGQKILCTVELVRRDKRLNAIYITNFGCGP